jgi:hypothetical protein
MPSEQIPFQKICFVHNRTGRQKNSNRVSRGRFSQEGGFLVGIYLKHLANQRFTVSGVPQPECAKPASGRRTMRAAHKVSVNRICKKPSI